MIDAMRSGHLEESRGMAQFGQGAAAFVCTGSLGIAVAYSLLFGVDLGAGPIMISLISLLLLIVILLKYRIWKPALIGGGLGLGGAVIAGAGLFVLWLILGFFASIAASGGQ
jgi:hypothetical protein